MVTVITVVLDMECQFSIRTQDHFYYVLYYFGRKHRFSNIFRTHIKFGEELKRRIDPKTATKRFTNVSLSLQPCVPTVENNNLHLAALKYLNP